MKLKITLFAAGLALLANTSTVWANDEHHDASKGEAAKSESAEAKKPVKRHNHVEEKANLPMPAPAAAPDKEMSREMPKEMHEHRHDHMKEKN